MNAKEFIKDGKNLIIKGDWDEFYVKAERLPVARTELNKILEGSGVLYTSILNKITKIPFYFLEGCEHIPNPLVLPSNIKEIGSSAFEGNKRLAGIVISDSVKSIGHNAFNGCYELESVVIPGSITSIGDAAFSRCSVLTSVTIGSGVTSIGNYAFYNCSGLTSITIPDSVTSIGYSAFSGCVSLTDVHYNGTKEQWNGITKAGDIGFNDGVKRTIYCIDGDIEI